jgi:hypothetical protein
MGCCSGSVLLSVLHLSAANANPSAASIANSLFFAMLNLLFNRKVKYRKYVLKFTIFYI